MQSQIKRRALARACLSSQILANTAETPSLLHRVSPALKSRQAVAASSISSRRTFFSRNSTQDKEKESEQKEQTTQNQETEKKAEQTPEQQQSEQPQSEQSMTPEQKKIKELEEHIASLKNDYLRCLADQQNLVRISKIDVENAKLYGIKGFASSIIEVADNLERALGTTNEAKRAEIPELESLYNGVHMTEKILLRILEKHGVAKFAPLGERFNPSLHEALFEMQDPTKTPGTVGAVQAAGYSLNGRLLRPAQVGVIATPPASS